MLDIQKMFTEFHPAFESIFMNVDASMKDVMDAISDKLNATITTVEQAEELEEAIRKQQLEFDVIVRDIQNCINSCENGEMTNVELMTRCKPMIAQLKACIPCKLAGVEIADDLSEEEIGAIRDLMANTANFVEQRKHDILNGATNDINDDDDILLEEGEESVSDIDEGYDVGLEIFEQHRLYKTISKSKDITEARDLVKDAKKMLKKDGNPDEAIVLAKKAQAIYEKVLAYVMKQGDFQKIKRVFKTDAIDEEMEVEITEQSGYARAHMMCKRGIVTCKAIIVQAQGKAGKLSFEETVNKIAEKEGLESLYVSEASLLLKAYEAGIDVLCSNIQYSIATEANTSDDTGEISETTERLRELEIELKDAVSKKDKKRIKQITQEIETLATDADKKAKKNINWKKVAKVGVHVIGAALVITGGVLLARRAKNAENDRNAAYKKLHDTNAEFDEYRAASARLDKANDKSIEIAEKKANDVEVFYKDMYNNLYAKYDKLSDDYRDEKKKNIERINDEIQEEAANNKFMKKLYYTSRRLPKPIKDGINDTEYRITKHSGTRTKEGVKQHAQAYRSRIDTDIDGRTLGSVEKSINRNDRKLAKIKAGKEAFGLEHLDDLEFIEVIESLGFTFNYEEDDYDLGNEDWALDDTELEEILESWSIEDENYE